MVLVGPLGTPQRLMMKLKLQYFGHLMRTDDSLEKTEDFMLSDYGTREDS